MLALQSQLGFLTALQEQALRGDCEGILAKKVTGSSRTGRTELQVLLDFLGSGDTLVVTRIDRLVHSIKDLQAIVFQPGRNKVSP